MGQTKVAGSGIKTTGLFLKQTVSDVMQDSEADSLSTPRSDCHIMNYSHAI